ncbi:peptidoglycan DD-metalloendopeptidase family protein [Ferrimonas gelatinilytica]|uniref:Peptidoglycan DD-metalloendopeptidase family protein n=1 Tax=Ferrimonas gelatinilytica TaxID=1255257 RepID=A0ABP9S7Q2_9GAMM
MNGPIIPSSNGNTPVSRRVRALLARLPRPHRAGIAALGALVCLLLLLPSSTQLAAQHSTPLPLATRLPLPLKLPPATPTEDAKALEWRAFEVASGDSLARLFDRAELSPALLHRITQLEQAGQRLVKILPGQVIELGYRDGQWAALRYQVDATETLWVQEQEGGLTERLEQVAVEKRQHFASAEITSNFWNAATAAGMTPNQIMRLAGLFGWDVDFALDIRAGDRFAVLWEDDYVNGHFAGDGDILVAEFVNQGTVFRAIRHDDGHYYAPDGQPMKKAFLRAPVQFNYVSSNFNPRRLHPVTGRVRAHNGTDYVAPVGTPIMAAGDGVVLQSGYTNLNGHYVVIQHSSTYVTKYLHLSKRLVKKGQRVKQGQTIGRLGATGRVTGAHLHYEFLVNGVHRNPRTVKLPESKPLAAAERPAFTQLSDTLLKQLAHRQAIQLAMQ